MSQSYSGKDNLEVMSLAENYNKMIEKLIISWMNIEERVIDFGCGSGIFGFKLQNSGFEVTGIENDFELRKQASFNGLNCYESIDDVQFPIHQIFMVNVLEHIEDDLVFLQNLKKKMAEESKIFIYVPAFNLLFSAMDSHVGHFRRYSKKSLEELIKRAGFQVVSIRYCDSLGFFAALALKFLGNRSGSLNPKMVVFYDKYIFPFSQRLDGKLGRLFGKNLYVEARDKRATSL